MTRGPYYSIRSVYTLTFQPEPDPNVAPAYNTAGDEISVPTGEPFSIGAHLKELSTREKDKLGYDPSVMVLEVLCADPMEGDARIAHGLKATITPDFMGLRGALQIQGRPLSRLTPVVEAIGVKYQATFQG